MKLLFDLFPVILFFIAYKQFNIFVATGVLMGATVVQIAFGWIRNRKVERIHLITFGAVMVFGGATILLRDPVFIKWKPSIVYWILAVAFVVSDLWKGTPLARTLMGSALDLASAQWRRLNLVWVLFFVGAGFLNLFVAFRFSENTWVNFKLFGLMGLTLLFVVGQAVVLRKHLIEPAE